MQFTFKKSAKGLDSTQVPVGPDGVFGPGSERRPQGRAGRSADQRETGGTTLEG